MMEGTNKELSIISYNCEHADVKRLPFMQDLFKMCDFLLLQEHSLYKSKLPWLSAVGSNIDEKDVKVGIHGVSAMDEGVLLHGRPNGGAVILWHESLGGCVTPIAWDSKRFCAVTYDTGDIIILIVCVYMPCDDWRPDGNVIEYIDILNEISTLSNGVKADCICIGGDFNTDFSRHTHQTNSLNSFIVDNDMFCCSFSNISDVQYTYRSKINNTRTLIDHFLVSENLNNLISEYSTIDNVENKSDHVALKCSLNISISYNCSTENESYKNSPAWTSANEFDINLYMELLDSYLMEIPLPLELINCKSNMCKSHQKEIGLFHDNIVSALVVACENSIPTANSKVKPKTVSGWNDHVEHYFRTALFWHKLWVDNGRPEEDDNIIANIRRTTRALYHKARKNVIKHQGLVQSDKLALSLENESSKQFWSKVKKFRPNSVKLPDSVDGVQDSANISEHFKSKFDYLFNCVSYNVNDMNNLNDEITEAINSDPMLNQNTLLISPELIREAIGNLKTGKNDGSLPLKSENLIYSTDIFHGHLSLLFSAMLRHGCSPEGMLLGTMVPLPKGRFNDLSNSKNFRALTISSLLGKLLDNIILNIESDNLCTNDLQFSFKPKSSTTMCTTMIKETISYFVNKGSNVYGLVLDATKAFDRINYCKLFKILLDRNVSPLICRLLLNMYTNQKLRVKWANAYSSEFSVSNGVKQGGVISPLLFCVYMDGLITELLSSNVGCFMGSVYAGIFLFADDIKLLAPSVQALNIMLNICLNYAARFDVIFNDKSQLIIFKSPLENIPTPDIVINGTKLSAVNKINHLGHVLHDNIFINDASKCERDFYVLFNSFLSDFRYLGSCMRNHLFFKYCTAFYGSQFLPVYDNKTMNGLYVAWRMALRKVWRVPWTTHNKILPMLADVLPPNLSFEKRSINFCNLLLNSRNKTVNMITGMAIYGSHSVLGQNIKHLSYKYNLNTNEVNKCWYTTCQQQTELVRLCEQIKELCILRDSPLDNVLTRYEAQVIIDDLCTD